MLSCFPDFLHAALEKVACAVFFEENLMEQATSPTFTGNPGFTAKGILTAFWGFGIRALRSNQS
jgi:hypothetical protein